MERFWLVFYGLILGIWCLTAGVHWGIAILLSVIAIIGAIAATVQGFRLSRTASETTTTPNEISHFHGFGALGWMLLVMMLLTTVSLIPLPLPFLELISPQAAGWYRESWQLAGVDNGWGYISVATGRTAFALWGLVGFWAIYVATMRLCGSRQRILRMSHILAVTGLVLLAMLAFRFIGHPISLGATGEQAAWHIGLPVNANHTSAIFALLSLLSLGSFTTKRHRNTTTRRTLWFIMYALFGIALIMLRSRGAIAAWCVGQLVILIYVFAVSRQIKWKTGAIMLAGLGIILAGVLFISAPTISAIKTEFAETSFELETTEDIPAPQTLSKTQLYGDFLNMGKDWGRTGTGRSAFYDVFPAYQDFSFPKHFRHAENEYWEILLEYGWFWGTICIALGILGFLVFLKSFWSNRDEHGLMYGLLAAIVAIAVQNIFDFNLRYWTAGMPFWIACGVLQARRNRWKYGKIPNDSAPITTLKRVEWIGGNGIAAVACLAAIIALPTAIDGQTQSGIRKLNTAINQFSITNENVQKAIEDNLSVRTGSNSLRKLIAQAYVREGSLRRSTEEQTKYWSLAKQWYQSAYDKSPRDPQTTLHLAKLLLALGDEKAAAEYFLKTVKNNPRLTSLAMNEMSVLKADNIIIPKDYNTFSILIQYLIRQNRFDDVQSLIAQNSELNALEAAKLLCDLYLHIGFEDGCNAQIDSFTEYPMNMMLFELKSDYYIRNKQYKELFEFIQQSENALRNEPDFWRKKLYISVFYGQINGESWYREQIPTIFIHYKRFNCSSKRCLFENDYYEAKYAFELKQYSRAIRSANHALKYRPGHKGTLDILHAAQKAQSERAFGK